MASNNCPACPSQTLPKFLVDLSRGASVNYWHCQDCQHIWMASKDGQVVIRHVTPLPERPPSRPTSTYSPH